jgi:mono/diheme cytochrome c family protein
VRPARPIAAALLLATAATAAPAQDTPAEVGLELSRAWCAHCHLVEPGGTAVDAGPPFESVANDPQNTEEGLRNWLADPHPPMPDLSLGQAEIDAILAYLWTLRHD